MKKESTSSNNKVFSFIKKYYNYFLFILVAFITCFIIYKEVKLEDLLSVIKYSNIYLLLVSIFVLVLYWLLEAFMLFILIRYEFPEEKFSHAFTLMMIGQYYNQVTPSSTGGQPLQLIEMVSKGIKPGAGTAVLVQKYALYQLSVTIVGIIGIFINISQILSWPAFSQLLLVVGLIVNALGSILIIIVALRPKIAHSLLFGLLKIGLKLHLIRNRKKWEVRIDNFISDYQQAVGRLKDHTLKFLLLFLINIFAILIYFSISYFIFKSFGISDIGIWQIIFLQSVCYLMMAFIPLPGAAGGAELSFLIVFAALVSASTISVALIAWRIITFYFILGFGGIYIATHSIINAKKN